MESWRTWASAPISSSMIAYGLSFCRRRCRWTCGSTRGSEKTAADLVNTMREERPCQRPIRTGPGALFATNCQKDCGGTPHFADHYDRSIGSSWCARRFRHAADPPERIDPATRTFMALRMAVNQEVENLEASAGAGPEVFEARRATGGHQLPLDGRPAGQAGVSVGGADRASEVLTKKPLSPRPKKLAANPRSRSAKLRVAQKE